MDPYSIDYTAAPWWDRALARVIASDERVASVQHVGPDHVVVTLDYQPRLEPDRWRRLGHWNMTQSIEHARTEQPGRKIHRIVDTMFGPAWLWFETGVDETLGKAL